MVLMKQIYVIKKKLTFVHKKTNVNRLITRLRDFIILKNIKLNFVHFFQTNYKNVIMVITAHLFIN
jgi:hypothetical protein